VEPASLSRGLAPWLGWTLGVEQWSDAWPLAVRRARIASAMAIHRHKGTVQAVKDVIAAYGGIFHLAEWWQQDPRGDPYTFALTLAVGGQAVAPSAELITALVADIDRAKPARAHFTVSVAINAAGGLALPPLRAGPSTRALLAAA
jgi:phage tail P2-like protein